MAEIRETHIQRDEEGRIIDKVTIDRPVKRGGGG